MLPNLQQLLLSALRAGAIPDVQHGLLTMGHERLLVGGTADQDHAEQANPGQAEWHAMVHGERSGPWARSR
ncbi:hypothetical protein D3C84_1099170 [compost metagenome]